MPVGKKRKATSNDEVGRPLTTSISGRTGVATPRRPPAETGAAVRRGNERSDGDREREREREKEKEIRKNDRREMAPLWRTN